MRRSVTAIVVRAALSLLGVMLSVTVVAKNVAPLATPTASSEFGGNFVAASLIDGQNGGLGNEWASAGEATPNATLTWDEPVRLTSIGLANRRASEQVLTGTLTFSDGSTVSLDTALPTSGTFVTLSFAAKNVTSVTFQVDTSMGGDNVGLAEFQANGRMLKQANIAPLSTPTTSSEFSSGFGPANLIDGGESGLGGQWASAGEMTPSATLTWDENVILTSIELADRGLPENVVAGTLTFSDGSTIDTGEIPFDGSNGEFLVVEFFDAPKTVNSVTFDVTTGTGDNEGLTEFRARGRLAIQENMSVFASASASSEFNGEFAASGIHDGVDGDLNRQWASQGELLPEATLTWGMPVRLTSVTLNDRPAPENVTGGTLTFSDGSTVPVGALPVDGSSLNIQFDERVTTSLVFTVDSSAGGDNIGLHELRAHGEFDDPPPPPPSVVSVATVMVSSEFGPGFGAGGLIDGPGGQWASQGEQTPWAEFSWPNTFVQLSGVSLQDRPGPEESIANGTLLFSDGTTIAVGPLPDDGTPLEVSFPEKVTQSVRFTADGGVGANVGLLEFGLSGVAPVNLAPRATPTVPSEFGADFTAGNLIDGVDDMNQGGQWVSNGNDTGGEANLIVTLTWPNLVMLTNVKLSDRPNPEEGINAGNLLFSDGTFVAVSEVLPDDGTPLEVVFDPKLVTSVSFEITDGRGPNVGLLEFQAIGIEASNIAEQASSIDVSSSFNADFGPDKLTDGFNGIYRDEWASAGEALPFAQLNWPTPVVLSSVVLVDRPNGAEDISSGELLFTDGTTFPVGAIPGDGQPLTVQLPDPVATESVRFTVTGSTGGNIGLREFEVYGIIGAPTGPILRPPTPAVPLGPADNRINHPLNTALEWSLTNIDNIDQVNIYLGTTMATLDLVEERTDVADTNYDTGTLEPNTKYYWRVDTINADGESTGTIRSFTTRLNELGTVRARSGSGSTEGIFLTLLLSVLLVRRARARRAAG